MPIVAGVDCSTTGRFLSLVCTLNAARVLAGATRGLFGPEGTLHAGG